MLYCEIAGQCSTKAKADETHCPSAGIACPHLKAIIGLPPKA
ncbi:hypothetical protein [Desulfitobacterium sp. LBE]|nr:hypothetical protein [Desulfitobacterium sp. LBE]